MITPQEQSNVEEAWAKFATLFRDQADPTQTVDAAARFLGICTSLGNNLPYEVNFTPKDFSLVGVPGMFMAAIGLAEEAVKAAQLREQLTALTNGIQEALSRMVQELATAKEK